MQVATKPLINTHASTQVQYVLVVTHVCSQPFMATLSNSTTLSDKPETSKWLFPDSDSVNSF